MNSHYKIGQRVPTLPKLCSVSPTLRAVIPYLTCEDVTEPNGKAPEAEGREAVFYLSVCGEGKPCPELLQYF